MKILFREADICDADFFYYMRMDDLTRKMSFNSDFMDFDTFRIGFESRVEDPEYRVFKAYNPMAMPSYPFGGLIAHRGNLSWMLLPKYRGQGLAKEMVKQWCFIAEKPIRAQIKYENTASQKVAEYAGFRIEEENKDYQQWIREQKS